MYFPGAFNDLFGDWSPDGKWITYTKIIASNYEKVYLYSIKNQKSYPVTDGLSSASFPCFDESGKYLYFMASTDAGPVVNWFAQSNQDMELTNHIYLATLQSDLLSPFAKKSDEESEKTETKGDSKEEETPAIDPKNIASRNIANRVRRASFISLIRNPEN